MTKQSNTILLYCTPFAEAMTTMVVKLVRAIRNGWIKFDKPKEESNLYLLWGDETDTADNKRQGLSYIPAPKPNLPDLSPFEVEGFDRCLDLYLCPRTCKKRINIDPESLKPKLPSKKDLRPYPKTCYLEFKGHTSPVKSISVEITGQCLASAASFLKVLLMVQFVCRRLKLVAVSKFGMSEVMSVILPGTLHLIGLLLLLFFKPFAILPYFPVCKALCILVIHFIWCREHDLLLINAEVGSEEVQMRAKELLKIYEMAPQDDTDGKKPAVRWMKHEKLDGITLIHHKVWLCQMCTGILREITSPQLCQVISFMNDALLMFILSKKHSHHPFRKLPGLPVVATFHPSQKMFFVATKKFVQVYDLQMAQLVKKLESGLHEISSISIHPGGDNVIVGSKDGKLCWFDTDLSTRPYKILKTHSKDIRVLLFNESTLFLPHPLRIVLPMYVMEWYILILTRTHLLYHWKSFVGILVQTEEVCMSLAQILSSVFCSLAWIFLVLIHAVQILVLAQQSGSTLCSVLFFLPLALQICYRYSWEDKPRTYSLFFGKNIFLGFSLYLDTDDHYVMLLYGYLKAIFNHFSGFAGVLDCKFHPKQPWLFTAGADSVIRLYCD
ncbi:Ribosome biogenesis protein ERB1 [Dichanthelium oligosanthes]|uniref:Ribosome biogenesis protein ERB1 n=1 Tax=Dichanthelium oligosanthes TaxID=888268 RepID=A0A1E5VRU9_9POAL|nr:Ribosome biogenesis protein ERB1 [Dichanthelium oligosanthes]